MDTEEVARLRLEKSLTLHRAKIEVLRQLEGRLDARITRLSELSKAAKTLIESMMTNPFQLEVELPQIHTTAPVLEPVQPVQPAPTLPELGAPVSDEGRKGSKSPGGYKRSVSWVSEPLHEEVTLNNKDTPQIPVHGHWVPQDVLERRASFQGETAQKLGGRQLELQCPSCGSVPCLLVEPMGKLINQEFVSTAMAIIFEQRFVADPKAMDEWAQVLKRTKLLDAGVSVAMPMLSPELELTEVVQAIMKFCSNDLCILSGKGPGASVALETAGRSKDATVAACLLFAPAPPAPERCGYEGPVMLVWAQDDQDSPFDQAGSWAEALALREAPNGGEAIAVLRDPAVGGHDLARMLRKDEACAADILSFVAASLLLIELRRLDGSQLQKDRLLRLFEELPLHLTHQFARRRLNMAESLEGKHADDLAIALVSHIQDTPTASLEIASSLSEWINSDMQRPTASASE